MKMPSASWSKLGASNVEAAAAVAGAREQATFHPPYGVMVTRAVERCRSGTYPRMLARFACAIDAFKRAA